MIPKKCHKKDNYNYTLEELFTRLIISSKHKNVVNVSYEKHDNCTLIVID